jgi:PKD repeat protein
VVQYRSTDADGNVEETRSVAFSIEEDGGDPDAPTVEAFADPASGEAPLEVQFSATGLDPQGGDLTYHWEFSEGGGTVQQSPTRTYTQAGTYTATVTVTDEQGLTASATVEVEVSERSNAAPSVIAAGDPTTGRAPLTVEFSSLATDPDGPESEITYLWDFGDDGANAFGRDASHTYREPGTYTATVTATDADGAFDTAQVTIVVDGAPANRPPTVQIAATPRAGTAPLPVRFTSVPRDPDGTAVKTVWDFGDGTKAGGANISHTYRTPGTYTATVTVTDPGGETATASVQIRVFDPAARGTAAPVKPPPVTAPTPATVAAPDASQGDVAGESAKAGASLKARKSQRIRRALRLQVACAERCSVRAVLRSDGKRLGKSRRLRIRDDRRHTLEVRLSRKVRRSLLAAMRRADARSVEVTAVLRVRTADGRTTIRRELRLRR